VITVRKAALTDLSGIVEFGKAAVAKTNYADLPYNATSTRRTIQGWLKRPDMRVWIALRDGRVCGVLIGSVDTLLFSHVNLATDFAFAAEAGGDKLLDLFIAWAKQMKAALIEMVSSQENGYERYGRLLQRKGFVRSGGVFRKDLREVTTCR
jgi:hypothetical protein